MEVNEFVEMLTIFRVERRVDSQLIIGKVKKDYPCVRRSSLKKCPMISKTLVSASSEC